MTIEYAQFCDIGARASENQDAVFCASNEEGGIFLVADGMGGHANGSYASNEIKKEVSAWWNGYSERTVLIDGFLSNTDSIRKALEKANIVIKDHTPEGQICGSTAVLLWVEDGSCAVLNCGDSRCYCVTGPEESDTILQLTRDDVWEKNPVNTKGLTEEEIRNNRNYGKLTRAVGTEKQIEFHSNVNDLPEECLFALCSDGVYKHVNEEQFYRKLRSAYGSTGRALEFALEDIRRAVYEYGASDNLSLVLVKVRN